MRIVEPKEDPQPQEPKPSSRRRRFIIVLLLFILIAGAGTAVLTQRDRDMDMSTAQSNSVSTAQQTPETLPDNDVAIVKTGELRIFTDNEFNVFYNNLLQPGLERVENPPVITGNDEADARIRDIAETRGYRLRSSPSADAVLVSVDGYLLQSIVREPWEQLQQAATEAGHAISIVSGYRSVSTQRSLFTQRLAAAGGSVAAVAAGQADEIVDQVLVESSIPGYSKHHTGYTIDLRCAGYVFENFKNSPCNDWITANNYEQAKTYGFIPSYPPEADAQGPDPEAWEYVYVGKELLTQ